MHLGLEPEPVGIDDERDLGDLGGMRKGRGWFEQPASLAGLGQPFFHSMDGAAGFETSKAYTTRPPRRMVA